MNNSRRLRPKEIKQRWHSANFSASERGVAFECGAVWRPDGPEVYETYSPLTAVLSGEAISTDVDRSEIFVGVLHYFFSEGPNPPHVMRRIFDLAFELDPKLLSEIPAARLSLLRLRSPAAHSARIAAVIDGTRCSDRASAVHGRLIESTLKVAVARVAGDVAARPRLELAHLLDIQEGEELAEYEARIHVIRALLGFIFLGGAAAGVVTRRVFCLAKWRPTESALLLDMTLEQLGIMFGEVRATWSWRVKNVINRFLEHRGARGSRSGFQKSAAACAIYSAAQLGNQNRRGGLRATA